MRAFVTVGSTKFDDLVQHSLKEEVLLSLRNEGYTNLAVQCGNSSFEFASVVADGGEHALERAGVSVEVWKFKPSLEEEFDKADLVISHAGAGTILDVLRKGKRLIVVPNETLLDNHQSELAVALEEKGHLKSSTVTGLAQTIEDVHKVNLTPFPPFDGHKFAGILDETMGFL
ncbi:glycosyltransferase 28 [Ephemerocybe angulata]|uniref:UDP-N-acetylglucosamine transferase subunit ALG13 n=1 Tax=Ephemerocybe angulata TaxID=980116 RepID=A0A8H6IJ31_9AGAR|nr:glycosyltransferase 28 [Tulosesus angulatus]